MSIQMVYFLRPIGSEGPIKIGCSVNPAGRLKTYSSWAPVPLEIAASISGGLKLERRFHAAFRHLHSHHEWFRIDANLAATIDAIRVGTFDLDTLPSRGWSPGNGRRGTKWTEGQRARAAVRRLTTASGIAAPRAVDEAVDLMDKLAGSDREPGRVLIASFLADPVKSGTLYPFPWAKSAFAKWSAVHGASTQHRSVGRAA